MFMALSSSLALGMILGILLPKESRLVDAGVMTGISDEGAGAGTGACGMSGDSSSLELDDSLTRLSSTSIDSFLILSDWATEETKVGAGVGVWYAVSALKGTEEAKPLAAMNSSMRRKRVLSSSSTLRSRTTASVLR
jgi:hypothetical protein